MGEERCRGRGGGGEVEQERHAKRGKEEKKD